MFRLWAVRQIKAEIPERMMKRFGKILAVVLVTLAVVLAAVITLTIGWRPFIGPRAQSKQIALQRRKGCHNLHRLQETV